MFEVYEDDKNRDQMSDRFQICSFHIRQIELMRMRETSSHGIFPYDAPNVYKSSTKIGDFYLCQDHKLDNEAAKRYRLSMWRRHP